MDSHRPLVGCVMFMTGEGDQKKTGRLLFFYVYIAILERIMVLFNYYENPIETAEFKKRNRLGDASDDKRVLP